MTDMVELKDKPDIYLKDKKYYGYVTKKISSKEYLFSLNHTTQWEKKKESYLADIIYHGEEKYFDGPEFKYLINEDGFRSKSFLEFNSNNINILFLGCSVTQGAGLPEECIWTTKLVDKIKNDVFGKQIDQYNLSITGGGIDLAVKNLISFLNTVGKPDYIFAYLPQISRSVIWNNKEYVGVLYANKKIQIYREEEERFSENYVVEDQLLYVTTLIHMMELICNLSGIKLIWSTWAYDQFKIIRDSGFNNYFQLNFIEEDHYARVKEVFERLGDGNLESYKNDYKHILKKINKSNINNEPYWSSARDGWHLGTSFHTHVAEKFYIELKSKYKY